MLGFRRYDVEVWEVIKAWRLLPWPVLAWEARNRRMMEGCTHQNLESAR